MQTILKLFHIMDKKHWVRMLVCFGPGIALHEIAVLVDAPELKIVSTGILAIGLLVYVPWTLVRMKFTTSQPPVEGHLLQNHEQMMRELCELCDGDQNKALMLVSQEQTLNPDHTYLFAIEKAYQRKKLEISDPVDNSQ